MRSIIFCTIFIAASLTSFGQSWINIEEGDIKSTGERYIKPSKYIISKVDNESIYAILSSAPKESAEIDIYASNTLVKLPLADGTTDVFRILEYAMMEPGLQVQYPNIRTYYGVSTTNPFRTVVADYTSFGFKAMITTINEGMVFIDNYQMGDISTKIIYNKKDNTRRDRWFCGVTDDDFNHSVISERSMMTGDCQLREYRLALSTNAEYTDFFIPGPSPPTAADSTTVNVGLVHSAVVTSMNRVNGVYMKEFAMRLILIANNNILYYFNTNTDGYTNNDGVAMLDQNQSKTTARIGTANFDIGHVFSTGGGGVASTSPCVAGSKARGVTGSGAPLGDAFDIDYVAHEMGHQFGANHTFASGVSNCGGGNRNNATAFEPGSGSSIMAYAGICAPENVQNNSDATFHAISLQEVKALQTGTGSCGQIINTPINTPPLVSPMPNYNIPISTPFALTISASDTDPMTYAWDQMNGVLGNVTTPPQSTNTSGPMFRNILPITSPTRYFPNLAGILLGNTSSASGWEVLPSPLRQATPMGGKT